MLFHSRVILIYVVGLRLISLPMPVIIVGFATNRILSSVSLDLSRPHNSSTLFSFLDTTNSFSPVCTAKFVSHGVVFTINIDLSIFWFCEVDVGSEIKCYNYNIMVTFAQW